MSALYHERIPNASGIYCITCVPTNKIYIGSAINLRHRRSSHFGNLQHNTHHNPKLQHAWNKYGEQNFLFEVLELTLSPFLLEREQYWLDTLNPFSQRGFNIAPIAGSSLGQKRSPESRKKMSAAQYGNTKKRGKKHSPEAIERHRLALLDYKHTEEAKRNMAKGQTGRIHSAESREKRHLSALGHAPTNSRTFILTSPEGIEFVVSNGLPGFCKEHHLSSSTLVQVAKGNRKQHKGWTARYPESNAE